MLWRRRPPVKQERPAAPRVLVEVWVDHAVPYLLMVVMEGEEYLVIDPHEQGQVLLRSASYEDAHLFLAEDGYICADISHGMEICGVDWKRPDPLPKR